MPRTPSDSESFKSTSSKHDTSISGVFTRAKEGAMSFLNLSRGKSSSMSNIYNTKGSKHRESLDPKTFPVAPDFASTAIQSKSQTELNDSRESQNLHSARSSISDITELGSEQTRSTTVVEIHNPGLTTLVTDAVVDQLVQKVTSELGQKGNTEGANIENEVVQMQNTLKEMIDEETVSEMINEALRKNSKELIDRENALKLSERKLREERSKLEQLKNSIIEQPNTEALPKVNVIRHPPSSDKAVENRFRTMQEQITALQHQVSQASNSSYSSITDPNVNRTRTPNVAYTQPPFPLPALSSSSPCMVTTSITTTVSSSSQVPSLYSAVSTTKTQNKNDQQDTSQEIVGLLKQLIELNKPGTKNKSTPSKENANGMSQAIDTIDRIAPDGIYNNNNFNQRSGASYIPPPFSSSASNPMFNNYTNTSLVQDLSTILSSRLPTIDIEKFSGDVKEYETFKTKFKTLIASSNASPEEMARTLYQALGNNVISQLDHIPNLNDPTAYDNLWASLDAEFGKFQHGSTAYITELTTKLQNWPPVRSSAEVHEFYKFLRSYYTSLEQINHQGEMEHSSIRVLILGRLTGKLLGLSSSLINHNPSEPVIKRILEYLKSHVRDLSLEEIAIGTRVSNSNNPRNNYSPRNNYQSRSNFLNLNQEEDFLNGQVNNVETRNSRSQVRWRDQHPEYRSPTRQNYNNSDRSSPVRNPWNQNSQNRPPPSSPNGLNNPQFIMERDQRFAKKCFFCCSDDHEPEACTSLANIQEYKDVLYKFRLCFNCLHQGHPNYQCLLPKRCNRGCNDNYKHASVVCTQNRQ